MPRLVLVTVGQDVNSLFNDGDDDQDELKQGTANDDLLIESLPAAVTIREVKYCSCQRNGSSTEHECCEVLVGMSWCTTIVVAKCSGGSAETRLLGWGGKQCVNPTTISGAEIRAMSRSCSIVTCSWNHWFLVHGTQILQVCETHSGASGTIWTKTLAIPSDETTMKTEIRDLQSNYSFAVALTETGAVHIYSHSTSSSVENTWGHGPLEFPHAGVRIAQVACGKTHTLLLQEDHTAIFSFGIDGHGQLGHGECSTAEVLVPRRIDALHGICVRTIAAGGWHSLVASVDGDVYTFGRDDCNQLGRMVVDVPASLPGYVDSFGEEQHIVAVAGGVSHSSVLTKEGRVFAWGANDFGQLGHLSSMGLEPEKECQEALTGSGRDAQKSIGRREVENLCTSRAPVEILVDAKLTPQAIFSNHSSNATCVVALAHAGIDNPG